MQRLAELHHDVVRHVDHIVDRAQPDALERLLQPLRRRADLHVADQPPGVAAAEVRRFDRDQARSRNRARRHLHLRQLRLGAEQAGDIARDAPHRKPVGTVRRDFDLNPGVPRKQRFDRQPELGIGGKQHEAVVIVGEPELLLAAHHPLRLDAAELRLLDFEIALRRMEDGSDRGDRNDIAGVAVRRAADDLQRAAAGIDRTDRHMVRIGVRRPGQDFADDHAGRNGSGRFDGFDFDSGHRQLVAESREVAVDRDVFGQPVARNIHFEWVLMSVQNCSRKRTSFSYRYRRSGIR